MVKGRERKFINNTGSLGKRKGSISTCLPHRKRKSKHFNLSSQIFALGLNRRKNWRQGRGMYNY
jgi:hypothetical protein